MAISVVSTINSHNEEVVEHVITMPDYIAVGNMILVFFTCSGDAVSITTNKTLSGYNWNKLAEYSSISNTATCFYKIADGSDILYINTDSTETSTAISYNLNGVSYSTILREYHEDSTANANPPNILTASGIQEYLFVVYAGISGTIVASSAPTSFINLLTVNSDLDGASSSSAHRLYSTTGTYDPGPFTSAAANYVSFTVCIAPSGVDGIGITSLFYKS